MKKWNLVFDVALCTGCQNCVLAVKDEYVGNHFAGYSAEMPRHGHPWVDIRERERGRFPVVRRYAWPLVREAIRKRSFMVLDAGIDLVTPPFINAMSAARAGCSHWRGSKPTAPVRNTAGCGMPLAPHTP